MKFVLDNPFFNGMSVLSLTSRCFRGVYLKHANLETFFSVESSHLQARKMKIIVMKMKNHVINVVRLTKNVIKIIKMMSLRQILILFQAYRVLMRAFKRKMSQVKMILQICQKLTAF